MSITINSEMTQNTQPETTRKRDFRHRLLRDQYLLLMLLPVLTYYIVFKYIPLYGVIMTFQHYNIFTGVFGSQWVGFDNYREIFSNSGFYRVLRNTLLLNGLSLLAGFPGPIIIALLLNEMKNFMVKRGIQTLVYLPHFLSWVVASNIILPLFAPNGMFNQILMAFGLHSVYFTADSRWWLAIYVFSGVWKEVGWGAILYLSALTAIDSQLYEAAVIDGAGKWKQLWHVTIAGILPTIVVLLILNLGGLVSIGFDQPFLLGNNAVLNVSDVISTYVYRMGILSDSVSPSLTIGVFQSLVDLILVLIANYIARRVTDEGIY